MPSSGGRQSKSGVQAAEAIVFVGTSLSVGLTRAVQKWAGETKAAVYHFNLSGASRPAVARRSPALHGRRH